MSKRFIIHVSTKKRVCAHCLKHYPRSTPFISISINEDTVDVCTTCILEWTEKINSHMHWYNVPYSITK